MGEDHMGGWRSRVRPYLACLFIWLLLAGCDQVFPQSTPLPEASPVSPTPTLTPSPTALPTQTVASPSSWKLTVWLPPQFDPAAENPAGALLQARLKAFDEQHSEFQVEARVKSLEGPGGMLDSLSTASLAAPLSLPDLVAMPRPLLETAALKGLVYPLDGLTKEMNAADWYGYARELAILQSSTFGLPFAGDALLLAYQPGQAEALPIGWETDFPEGTTFAFPASDPQALFTLLMYQSAGGSIMDDQGRPSLDEQILAQVLTYFQQVAQAGAMPFWLTQYESAEQSWQGFQDQQSTMVVAWASQYFNQLMQGAEGLAAGLAPAPEGRPPFTLATGWVWAAANPQSERRKMSLLLAEFLLEDAFLAEWTRTVGLIPPRSGALLAWEDNSTRQLAEQLALSATLYPSSDILSSLGPVLKEATVDVIKQEKDPLAAAQAAVNHLQSP